MEGLLMNAQQMLFVLLIGLYPNANTKTTAIRKNDDVKNYKLLTVRRTLQSFDQSEER